MGWLIRYKGRVEIKALLSNINGTYLLKSALLSKTLINL